MHNGADPDWQEEGEHCSQELANQWNKDKPISEWQIQQLVSKFPDAFSNNSVAVEGGVPSDPHPSGSTGESSPMAYSISFEGGNCNRERGSNHVAPRIDRGVHQSLEKPSGFGTQTGWICVPLYRFQEIEWEALR